MNPQIKLSFVYGLKEIVLHELKTIYADFVIQKQGNDFVYIEYFENFEILKKLKSVSRVYLVTSNEVYHPKYLCKHKLILGELIGEVLIKAESKTFKNFKISCAGAKSSEVKEISRYIVDTFKIEKTEDEADLKIHISKMSDDMWEVGLQITPRPLSVREYKVQNMSGAMDPTIAYAMNSLVCTPDTASYLNVFSGSATLLIEAMQEFPGLKKIIGFDNNKEHLSYSIQNIKKAGLIKKIEIKEYDVFDSPDLGIFDVIVADLPFGMVISKDADLEKLYKSFVEYAQAHISQSGTVAVYTSQSNTFESVLTDSNLKIIKKLPLKIITSQDLFLSTCIFVCALK